MTSSRRLGGEIDDQTTFQSETLSAVTELLSAHGRKARSELLEGVVPFYSQDPVRAVKLQAEDLVVWIFEDDAVFSCNRGGATHERQDFESEEALRKALLADIAATFFLAPSG